MSVLELDVVEPRRDPGGPILVAGEEDVLGQFAWTESDVVLPFAGGDRDPAIDGRFDAVIRVRQDLSLAQVAASLARNSAEDSPAFSRASSRAGRARPTLGHARGRGWRNRSSDARQTGRDAVRQPAPRVLASGDGHGDREQGREQERSSTRNARVKAPRRRAERRELDTAPPDSASVDCSGDADGEGVASTAGSAATATGSPANEMPPGASTTTTTPSSVTLTWPIALSASSGSMSASWAAASPVTSTRPRDVPSSSVNPSGASETTRPPTRTRTPAKEARSTISASTAPAGGAGSGAPVAGLDATEVPGSSIRRRGWLRPVRHPTSLPHGPCRRSAGKRGRIGEPIDRSQSGTAGERSR